MGINGIVRIRLYEFVSYLAFGSLCLRISHAVEVLLNYWFYNLMWSLSTYFSIFLIAHTIKISLGSNIIDGFLFFPNEKYFHHPLHPISFIPIFSYFISSSRWGIYWSLKKLWSSYIIWKWSIILAVAHKTWIFLHFR